tara:strand:+ start:1102 stop:2958 length:1857 start_codon:yes stop_codon:yes gene_type:complete
VAQWKKIITSGSNAALNNITASNDISASGNLFISSSENSTTSFNTLVIDTNTGQVFHTGSYAGGGGGGSNGTQITLGADTTGNNNFTSNTTVTTAIDNIDTILGLLAPAKPPNLSAISLVFHSDTTNYSAKDKDNNTVTNVTNTTNPSFVSSENFYNGDSGTLAAQTSQNGGGNYVDSNNLRGDRILTVNDDSGTYNILQIVDDVDPYVGQVGKSGFYKELSVKLNPTSLTINDVGDYTRKRLVLIHDETGPSPGISIDFTVDSNPATDIENLAFDYNESINGFHYQSGIKYLGNDNTITQSHTVTIDSNANFVKLDGTISQTTSNISFHNEPTKTVTTWTPGQSYNVTHSLNINNSIFSTSSVQTQVRSFNASGSYALSLLGKTLLIDSTNENEIIPVVKSSPNAVSRKLSGKTQYPPYGTLPNDNINVFGDDFDSSTSLTDSNKFELQFANQYYHWPAATNYSSHTPSGPNYTSISGDSSNNNLRYATFNLGTITNKGTVTLNITNTYGFDNALIQTSDNFQLHLKVMDGTEVITDWINGNGQFSGAGNTLSLNGIGGLAPGGHTSGGNGSSFVRVITFGDVVVTGTVYVRIGWGVSGGTNPLSTSTRKFKYIYKS